MSADDFRFEPYTWCGEREWMLVHGHQDTPYILMIPPLFEEMNFTRALLAGIGRALAARGVTSWLPDLPGTGESLRPLATIGWQDWRDAAAGAAAAITAITGTTPFCCAFRGGVLLDDAVVAQARWRYAPVAGEALLRQMRRTQLLTDRESGEGTAAGGEPVELAGYPLSPAMRDGLAAAVPADVAHQEVAATAGTALWRRAEPTADSLLSEQLATDIHDWMTKCVSR